MIETLILGAPPAALQLAATLTQRRRPVQLLPTPDDFIPPVDVAWVADDPLRDGYSLLSNGAGLHFTPGDADPDAAYAAYLDAYAAAFRLQRLPAARVSTVTRNDQGYLVHCADGRQLASRMLAVATPPAPAAWQGPLAGLADAGGHIVQSSGWEAAQSGGIFVVGPLMDHRQRGAPVDELPGSLRYPARVLGHLMTERPDRYANWPSSAYTNRSGQLTSTLLERARSGAGLRRQAGYLVDVLARRPGERAARLYKEVPAGLVDDRYGSREQTFRLTALPGPGLAYQIDHVLDGAPVDQYRSAAAAADAADRLQQYLSRAMRQASR